MALNWIRVYLVLKLIFTEVNKPVGMREDLENADTDKPNSFNIIFAQLDSACGNSLF